MKTIIVSNNYDNSETFESYYVILAILASVISRKSSHGPKVKNMKKGLLIINI